MRYRTLILVLMMVLLVPIDGYNQVRNKPLSRPQILQQQAETMMRLGRRAEAVDLYRELINLEPQNTSHYYRLASILRDQEGAEILLEVIDQVIKYQPGQIRLLAEKGRLLYVLDRKAEAQVEWDQIIGRFGQRSNTYAVVAQTQLQAGAVEEALALLLANREQSGDSTLHALDLARVYAARMDIGAATDEYLRHLTARPQMEQYISQQLIRLAENDSNLVAMKPVLLTSLDRPVVVELLAKLYLNHRQYTDVADLLASHGGNLDLKEWLNLADDLKAEAAWVPASQLYLHVAGNSREARQQTTALLGLAESYEQRLVRRDAYESLGGYFPGNRFLQLDIRATDLSDVSMDRALFLYDSLRFMLPRSPQAYQAMSRIAEIQLTMLDDYDAAIRGFDQVMAEAPQRQLQLYSGIRLVDAWLSKGDTTRARKELQRTLELTGADSDEPLVAYSRAKVDLHRGDLAALQTELLNLSGAAGPGDPLFNDALELLAIMEGNGGVDNPQLEAYFRAERLIGQHKLTQATEDLLAIHGNSQTIADEAHARAIQLLRHLGKQADAQAAMEQFLKTYPDSQWRPQVLTWLGELYQYDYGDPMGAVAYYEAVVVEYPTFLQMQAVRLRLRAIIGGGS